MYGLLWRILPGPAWLRALVCLILALAVVYVLFEYVFPVIAPHLPFNDGTVQSLANPPAEIS